MESSASKNFVISEEIYKVLLESASEGMIVVDKSGIIQLVNKKAGEMFGYKRGALIGKPVEVLMPDAIRKVHVSYRDSFYDDPSQRPMGTGRYLVGMRGNGEKFPIEVSLTPVHTDRNMLVMAFITDITARRVAEEKAKLHEQQLLQADKMATLGILVSGVAHEINNPTGFILLNGKIFSRMWDDLQPILEKHYDENGDFMLAGMPYTRANQKIGQLINGVSEGAERIRKIVKSLKDFARQDAGDLNERVNLNSVIETGMIILNNLIKKSTDHFTVDAQENLPDIRGNSQQLEQVLINLVTNACQALPGPESGLTVSTSYTPEDESVLLIVKDDGDGISEENLKRIMDPFFTTKQSMGGTGLGLSISYNIITNHGGTMTFESAPGKGTRVTVTLPLKHADAAT